MLPGVESTVSAESHSMQVAITARHGSVKPELSEYVTRKSEKLVRYLDQVSEIDVTFEFEAERVSVEMLVEIVIAVKMIQVYLAYRLWLLKPPELCGSDTLLLSSGFCWSRLLRFLVELKLPFCCSNMLRRISDTPSTSAFCRE